MSFDPCNCALKTQESIETPISKVGAHLGVWGFIPSHSLALLRAWNVTLRLTFGPHLYKPLLWLQTQGQGCDIKHYEDITFLLVGEEIAQMYHVKLQVK
jgi:hypothetical protein